MDPKEVEKLSDGALVSYVTTLLELRDWLRLLWDGPGRYREASPEYDATTRLWDVARAVVVSRGLVDLFDGCDADLFAEVSPSAQGRVSTDERAGA